MSLFSYFKNNLQKTSNFLSLNIINSFLDKKVDAKTLEELESVLISADISIEVVSKLIDSVRKVKNDKEDILMSLNGKWRNCYRKGVKLGVNVVDVSYNKEAIAKLIDNYKTLQSQKEFIGLSTKLNEAMATKSNKYWKFLNLFHNLDHL